ncbi:MAG TPA: PilZ domain-containing protein [Kofleriaceae bacterium]|jgi:Tfp pilus assembly protein PilZ|nr:PilZ domain-containing protein [Kofleriaceae bacterium]
MGWWHRLFGDKANGQSAPAAEPAPPPSRRAHERFSVHTRVVAKCASWPRFLELVTGDVSAGGLFIPTEAASSIGEKIEIDLTLPDGSRMPMTGTVVRIMDAAAATVAGKRAGLGVKLDAPAAEHRQRFHELLAHALSLSAARRTDQQR